MATITGIENLKNKFREAKLKCGDLRGLKNRFELSAKLNISPLHTFYYSVGGNGENRMELVADCYGLGDNGDIYAYTMKDLTEQMKEREGEYDVHLVCLVWNKARNDANRKEVLNFTYKNK